MVLSPPHRDETQILMHFAVVSNFCLKDPLFFFLVKFI